MPSPVVAIERLLLADLRLPDWHPRASERSCLVFGYAIRHRDGVIVFDTGVGIGHDFIDDVYQPQVVAMTDALNERDIDERDVVAVVNSHLHFDHCGQNDVFHARGTPVYVQAAELEASRAFGYTVPEWAEIPPSSLRAVHGDAPLADGVRLVETIGHTPGHQSLVVDTDDGVVVVAGQCVYRTDELTAGRPADDNAHDQSFIDAAQDSLARLLALEPRRVVVAHDVEDWTGKVLKRA